MVAVLTFDVAAFKLAYPAFNTVDNAVLQGYWNSATCFVSPLNFGWLYGACRQQAINLMTAHLAALAALIAGGETPQVLTSAQVDKVSVGMEPPPSTNQWGWWLNTTPYGMQLNALLQAKSVGGLYVTPRCGPTFYNRNNGCC